MVIALFVFMGLACAKQGYPPGGPEDKTPPRLESSTPAAGATAVSRDGVVVLEFSESMNPDTVEDNLFIVPIPSIWPEFRWRSRDRVLEIEFAEPLLENTTYVLSVGAKASDLRRNELDDSIMLSFSTGDRLENGMIRGTVVPYSFGGENPQQVNGVDVAAFRIDGDGETPDPRFDVPDYVTQSGSDGSYEMIGLSSGTYRLFAIGDKDRNGFYSEGYDLVGIGPHDVVLAADDSVSYAPDLAISLRDTSAVQIVSIGVADSRRIELFFDRSIDPASVNVGFEGLDVLGWFVPPDNRAVVSVATAPQEDGRRYTLSDLAASDREGNAYRPFGITPYFDGTDRPDTTALAIVGEPPSLIPPGNAGITLAFNRMLDIPDETDLILAPSSREDMEVREVAPNAVELVPLDAWREGASYRAEFDTERIRGVAGNTMAPDAQAYEFRVAAADTLGFIEGTIEDATVSADNRYRIQLYNIDTGARLDIDAGNALQWSSGAVLPGRYLARAFRDVDGDGLLDRGSIDGFRAAEQVSSPTDTIAVVSRWTYGENVFIFR